MPLRAPGLRLPVNNPILPSPLAALKQHLEAEKALGAPGIFLSHSRRQSADAETYSREAATALAALQNEFSACALCSLSRTRTNIVFGSGSPNAKLFFVGEAPGFDEDKEGLPFVGAAGQLLSKIIQAMKLRREDVYIANCLKCRPPQNRNPLPSEIVACNPILMRQIEIIRPQVICALGKFAAQTLLGSDEPISRLRGKFHEWKFGAKIMATFHPAYLLRNPEDKKIVWQDMQQIMAELGLSNG